MESLASSSAKPVSSPCLVAARVRMRAKYQLTAQLKEKPALSKLFCEYRTSENMPISMV